MLKIGVHVFWGRDAGKEGKEKCDGREFLNVGGGDL